MRLSTAVIATAGALSVLVFCPSVSAAQPAARAATVPAPVNLWQYVHPETKFLAGLDWQRAKESPAGRMFAKQLAGQKGMLSSSGPALAILDNFDRLLISSTGREPEAAGQMPPVVVAVEGKLDRAKVRKLMPPGTATERFMGIDLFIPPKSPDSDLLLALVNDRVSLIADRASLATILGAPAGAHDAALLERANQLAAQCELWAVSAVSPARASGNSLPAMKQLDDIESLDLGLSLQKGLGLRANLITKSEDSAKGLATLVQLITSMASQDPKQSPEVATIMRGLNVATDGPAVRFSMDVTLAQLEKGFASVQTAGQNAGKRTLESFLGLGGPSGYPSGVRPAATVASARPAPPIPPPAPPKPKTIRIVGMDDGPKEITYQR